MNPDEFEDRYRALETLTVQLIRHMKLHGLLNQDQVSDLMGSMTNLGDCDARATWCAERLVRRVVGDGRTAGESWDRDRELAEQRARAYGGMPDMKDL